MEICYVLKYIHFTYFEKNHFYQLDFIQNKT